MKGAKVFWAHLVLWTGGVVALSLLANWLLAGHHPDEFTEAPIRAQLWFLATRIGRAGMPHQAHIVQTIALALAISAYPAGLAAARHVLGSRRQLRSWLVGLLPLVPLSFLLVGYLIPDAARLDSPGLPAGRQSAEYLYFHELPSAAAGLQARADAAARALYPAFLARHPEMTRAIGMGRRLPAAEQAATLRSYARFTAAFAFFPALLALLGLCVGLWSNSSAPPLRRLQAWTGGLVLCGAVVVYVVPWEARGGLLLIDPWWDLVGRGAPVLAIPALLLLPLVWTLGLARDRFFPPTNRAAPGPAVAEPHVA